jgi:hypothetical protein
LELYVGTPVSENTEDGDGIFLRNVRYLPKSPNDPDLGLENGDTLFLRNFAYLPASSHYLFSALKMDTLHLFETLGI